MEPAPGSGGLIKWHPVLAYYALVFAISWPALLAATGGPLPTFGAGAMANPLFVLGILMAPLAVCGASPEKRKQGAALATVTRLPNPGGWPSDTSRRCSHDEQPADRDPIGAA